MQTTKTSRSTPSTSKPSTRPEAKPTIKAASKVKPLRQCISRRAARISKTPMLMYKPMNARNACNSGGTTTQPSNAGHTACGATP
nr:hypothetical protein [Formosimonas limnophila]